MGARVSSPGDYDIRLDEKFGALELIDVGAEAAAHEPWFNQTLARVNDAVVRLGVIEGDFHWHKHDDQDEFFLVVDGRLVIDVEDRESVTLEPRQGYTVPRGVMQCTHAPVRTTILMVEADGETPSGDASRSPPAVPSRPFGPKRRGARFPDRYGHGGVGAARPTAGKPDAMEG